MNRVVSFLLLSVVLISVRPAVAAEVHTGAQFGAVGGLGGDLYLEVADFAQDLPVDLRIGFEYQARDAGDPMAARRVFINNNTNGTPESSASAWGARLDLVWPLDIVPNVYAFGGPRWASFTSSFEYIGGDENFDVVSSHWGWGGGLEGRYPISPSASFVLGGGLDWFLGSELDGHDTIYSPDLDPVNGREDYEYSDADDAVNQPRFEWRLLLGFQYRLGS